MKSHMSGIFIGEFLVAIAFAMLWARIALGGAGIQCGSAAMQNAVQPLPVGLMMKWITGGILQSVFVGIVLFFVHKPVKVCRRTSPPSAWKNRPVSSPQFSTRPGNSPQNMPPAPSRDP